MNFRNIKVTNNNIGYLCTDWQIEQGRRNKIALKWISSSNELCEFSFNDLVLLSNKAANSLKDYGVVNGDRIMILLPKIPELFAYFLGTLKLGLNCCVLFSSIGEDSLRDRILDTGTRFIISNSGFGSRLDKILPRLPVDFKVFMIDESTQKGRKFGIHEKFLNSSDQFETRLTPFEQYSHFHFTSGSTGNPKGVQHVHGAVESQLQSFLEVMQPEENDLYWCTADPGWITGTSYGIIAPWLNGTTQIHYAGNFSAKNWMEILQNYNVNIWYTAPTVLRMMMQVDDKFYEGFNLKKLKRIYCVGEPLNPVILEWGRRVLNRDIYDTWFQTETGSIMISNKPGIIIKPGSMGKPLSFVQPTILDETGNVLGLRKAGNLCIQSPWASMFRTYINHEDTYRKKFSKGYYYSGDIALIDEDGYYWFSGRSDDIINTAGHLVSPFEVESSLLEMDEIVDVGVVGIPDEMLFERVIAFVVLAPGISYNKLVDLKIKKYVTNKVSTIASPREIHCVPNIPKTKSGKIMRRILRCQITGEPVGDISTLEDQ